ADERVDLAGRRRDLRPGVPARADGGADPLRGPGAAAADDALRLAFGGTDAGFLRRAAARRAPEPERERGRPEGAAPSPAARPRGGRLSARGPAAGRRA